MQKWEYCRLIKTISGYMVEFFSVEKEYQLRIKFSDSNSDPWSSIAKLGLQGWELVTVTPDHVHRYPDNFYFKRPLPE